jgi:hypothetical protein
MAVGAGAVADEQAAARHALEHAGEVLAGGDRRAVHPRLQRHHQAAGGDDRVGCGVRQRAVAAARSEAPGVATVRPLVQQWLHD